MFFSPLFLGDVYDYMGQRVELTQVSCGHQNVVSLHLCPAASSLASHTQKVDFSFNPLADPGFTFHDHALVEAVKLEKPEVHAFFRLLALCHTVMAEEKKEGGEVKLATSLPLKIAI